MLNRETHRIDFEFVKREQPSAPRNSYYPEDVLTEYYEPVIPDDMAFLQPQQEPIMESIDHDNEYAELFGRLDKSDFRSRFRLDENQIQKALQ